MTWTRLDDGWTDRPILEQLSYDVRWHYLALVQFCSRTGRYDGIVRAADARRCSDVPDPMAANDTLVSIGLLVAGESGFRVALIDEHIPPPHLRDESRKAQQRDDTRRHRAHKAGEHSLCLPGKCKALAGQGVADTSADVSAEVSAYIGTGQDGTGQDEVRATKSETDWPEVQRPGAQLRSVPGALSHDAWQHLAAGYDH